MGKKIGLIIEHIYTFINDLMHADSDEIRKDAVGIHNIERSSKGKHKVQFPWKGLIASLALLVIATVIFVILWSVS